MNLENLFSFEFLSFAFLIIFKLWLTLFNLTFKGFVKVEGGTFSNTKKIAKFVICTLWYTFLDLFTESIS